MNISGYCPYCKVSFDGDLVINYPRSQGKSYEEILEYARCYAGFTEHGLDNRWSRKISIYCTDRDRTISYRCPDCNKEWGR
jgi:hypothetical protein